MTIIILSVPSFAYDELSPTDAEIIASIRSETLLYGDINDSNVQIDAKNGVVSFNGYIDSVDDANELIEITKLTPGVYGVDVSKLKIGNNVTESHIITEY